MLRAMQELVTADEYLLLSDRDVGYSEWEPIQPIRSLEELSDFMLRRYHRYITTRHVLNIQTDGYIRNPAGWNPSWLQYDYIGASWLWHPYHTRPHAPPVCWDNDVGNGGFSLRSKEFLEATSELSTVLPSEALHPEDVVACRIMGPMLKAKGIKFAPKAIADKFSVEERPYEGQFGFHGKNTIAMQPAILQEF